MPKPTNDNNGDRYEGLRGLQRRERRPRVPTADSGDAAGRTTRRGSATERLARLRVPGTRRWTRRTLIGVNIAVALCLVCGAAAFAYVDYRLGQVERVSVPALTSASSSGPLTILIVGSDSRDLGSGNSQFGSTAEVAGQRSDTVMLIRVVPAASKLEILSIPRDLWVNIKGMGYSKINSAFNNGPQLLVSTIRTDLGIPINHYIEVNFDSFRDITDAVGGVKFWFPTPAKDLYSNLDIPKAGCVNLTGNQALAFVRSRHYQYYEDGQWITQGLSDLARIQRQQAYVKKMLKKVETRFTNPIALNDIIGSIAGNLTVDKGFTPTLMIGLAEALRAADVAGIPTETLPTNNIYPDGEDALSLQQPAANNMITSFNDLGTSAQKKAAPAKPPAPSSVAVEVANGSGVNNQAAVAATALSSRGYQATVTTTSPGYTFTDNEIDYAPDSLAAAKELAKDLAGTSTLVVDSSLTPTPYNLELVTGHKYAGLGAGTADVKSLPSAATEPYVLPGPQPTAAELASC